MSLNKINKLVLSIGGAHGYTYIGMLRAFEEHHIVGQFKYIIGTSIGSLFALCMCLGYTSQQLLSTMMSFNYQDYQSVNIISLFERYGLDDFSLMERFIRTLLTQKKYDPQITLKNLYEKTHIHLMIHATCLNTHTPVIFDHLNFPEMPVVLTCHASMAIPFLFVGVTYQGLTYVDGCLQTSYCIEHPLLKNEPDTIMIVNLVQKNDQLTKEINGVQQYVQQIVFCLYQVYDQISTHADPSTHLINVLIPPMGAFNFDFTSTEKKTIIETGYQTVKQYLEQHTSRHVTLPFPSPSPSPSPTSTSISDLTIRRRLAAMTVIGDLKQVDILLNYYLQRQRDPTTVIDPKLESLLGTPPIKHIIRLKKK
jgi:predicted acylesterase/phospholipase RssA